MSPTQGVYAMGFNAPSKIQETALPTLLADPPQNMIAQSQSGTGGWEVWEGDGGGGKGVDCGGNV